MTHIILKSNKIDIKKEDLWNSPIEDQSEYLVKKIEKLWIKKQRDYLNKKRQTDFGTFKLAISKAEPTEDFVFLKSKSNFKQIQHKKPSFFLLLVKIYFFKLLFAVFLRLLRDLSVLSSTVILG